MTQHSGLYSQYPEVQAARARVAKIGALLFQRHLTDAAGGNVSVRVSTPQGDVLCMSPRYAGSNFLWELTPDDVLIVSLTGEVLEGAGTISREAKAHLRLHNTYGHVGRGVVHCHARHVLVFAALAMPIPPVLEATRKFGEVPVIPYAPSHSNALAENVVAGMAGMEERITKQAAAVIAPWHGLFVMGKDVNAAFDAAERIDNNAFILLQAQQFTPDATLAAKRAEMERSIKNFVDVPAPTPVAEPAIDATTDAD